MVTVWASGVPNSRYSRPCNNRIIVISVKMLANFVISLVWLSCLGWFNCRCEQNRDVPKLVCASSSQPRSMNTLIKNFNGKSSITHALQKFRVAAPLAHHTCSTSIFKWFLPQPYEPASYLRCPCTPKSVCGRMAGPAPGTSISPQARCSCGLCGVRHVC